MAKYSERAAELDAADPFREHRQSFLLNDGLIYLDGNSLGPLTAAAANRAQTVVHEQWGQDLIASWNRHGWIDLPHTVGEKIATLIGAGPGQVICCDSISINLFKLLALCLQLRPGRSVVLSQQDNFPTDLYAAQGLQQLLGSDRCQLQLAAVEELDSALKEEVAVLCLTEVNFRSGARHDMVRLTRLAHEKGILVLWDLAHSAGVMPLQLDSWDVDFAVGCGYKYLNGGPGAPAFVYANARHHQSLSQPLSGWMGHVAPFDFLSDYEAAPGMASFLSGTPPVVSMALLDAALDTFADVNMQHLYEKAMGLSELFREMVQETPQLVQLQLASPVDMARRGAQLAYRHPQAYPISQALIAAGVIGDFRAPDLLRLGFSPLLLSYADTVRAVEILTTVIREEQYRRSEFQGRSKVT